MVKFWLKTQAASFSPGENHNSLFLYFLQPLTGAMTISYNFFFKMQTLQGSAVDKLMRNTIVAVRSKELIMVKCEEIIAFIWGLSV